MKAVNHTELNTELDWADSDVHNRRRVGEADTSAVWSDPDWSEPVTKVCKHCVKMGTHKSYKPQMPGFTNFETVL